jgi:hypothetical protein
VSLNKGTEKSKTKLGGGKSGTCKHDKPREHMEEDVLHQDADERLGNDTHCQSNLVLAR